MISIVCITNRIGGLDVLFQSLHRQTHRDFELVLVDALYKKRSGEVLDERTSFPVTHIPPRDNPFPKASFARSQNTGITHARGDIIVFLPDYSWLAPDCLATHAAMQERHPGPVTLDYNYAFLPPTKPGLPHYRESCSGDSPDYVAEVNANTERYAADVRAGKLDAFMWSIFQEPLTEDAMRALKVEHRHRPSGADLANDWNYASTKNESFPTELLLELNGFDELYDASHLYQDSELSYRLRERGIRWHAGPPETGMVTVVNPRNILNIKHLEKPLSHNKEMCFGSRRAELNLPVNPERSLRQERAKALGLTGWEAFQPPPLPEQPKLDAVIAKLTRPTPQKCNRCPVQGVISFTLGDQTAWLCASCARPIVAHVNSTPTMMDEAISTPFPVVSRGKLFQVVAAGEMWHPSWWSFSDELETREQWWTIKPGDVVADIGADFGSYTLSALAQGAATVYAWSPPFKVQGDALECRTMRRSAALNGWAGKLVAFDTGLWSKPGYLAVRDDGRVTELCATLAEAQERIVGGTSYCGAFGVSTLDSLGLGKLDFIKADVEGGELEILKGSIQTIKRCRPRILFENHVHIDPECEAKCVAFLRELGYRHVGTRPHHSVSHTLMEPQ